MYAFHNNRQKPVLDETDVKILNILQQRADMSFTDIAAKVFRSHTNATNRIRKMQNSGIIKKIVAVLDRQLVGRPTLVVTMVKLNNHSAITLRNFAAQMNLLDEVQFCLHLSGEYDFLLQVTLRDPQEYEEFLDSKLCALPVVEKVQSSFVLRECKTLAALPLVV
jgi:Lrp/AsnC family leucine-responsive transcriptional regulator